jgi:hypothetical protein
MMLLLLASPFSATRLFSFGERSLKTCSFLRSVSCCAFALVLSISEPANALEASCNTFNKLLTHDGKYQNAAVFDQLIPGLGFQSGFAFTNAKRDALVNVATIQSEEGKYLVALQMFPTSKVLAIAHTEIGAKEFPKEIADALAGMSMTVPTRWKDNKLYPAVVNQCDRLQGIISGDEFSDAKSRIFVRHFVFGHRTSSGRMMCNGTNSEQLTFYEAFVPRTYLVDGGNVIIDGGYAGIEKDGVFEYPCLLNTLLQGREKPLSGSQVDELEPKRSLSSLRYLEGKSVISHDEFEAYQSDPKGSWELQTLLNIFKGRQIFNEQ